MDCQRFGPTLIGLMYNTVSLSILLALYFENSWFVLVTTKSPARDLIFSLGDHSHKFQPTPQIALTDHQLSLVIIYWMVTGLLLFNQLLLIASICIENLNKSFYVTFMLCWICSFIFACLVFIVYFKFQEIKYMQDGSDKFQIKDTFTTWPMYLSVFVSAVCFFGFIVQVSIYKKYIKSKLFK